MRVKRDSYLRERVYCLLCLFFMLPIKSIAQDSNLWNRVDSVTIDSTYSQLHNNYNNSIVGIWESHNGVVFMIKDCIDKNDTANYQIIMIEDKVSYGDWHIKVKYGNVIGLLSNTSDKNIFSCKLKRRKNDVIKQFHLSLKGSKLVYTGSSNLRRKLFAVKLYPELNDKPIKTDSHSPLLKNKIEREFSK